MSALFLKRKSIASFIVIFVGAFVLLYGLNYATGFEKTYKNIYAKIGTVFFEKLGNRYTMEWDSDGMYKGHPTDITVAITDEIEKKRQKQNTIRQAQQQGQSKIKFQYVKKEIAFSKIFRYCLFPLIIFLSLVLAAPVSWKRKGIAAILGLLLLHLFFIFKLWFSIQNKLYELQMPRTGMGNWLNDSTLTYLNALLGGLGLTLLVVLLIFILTTFKKDDLINGHFEPI